MFEEVGSRKIDRKTARNISSPHCAKPIRFPLLAIEAGTHKICRIERIDWFSKKLDVSSLVVKCHGWENAHCHVEVLGAFSQTHSAPRRCSSGLVSKGKTRSVIFENNLSSFFSKMVFSTHGRYVDWIIVNCRCLQPSKCNGTNQSDNLLGAMTTSCGRGAVLFAFML